MFHAISKFYRSLFVFESLVEGLSTRQLSWLQIVFVFCRFVLVLPSQDRTWSYYSPLWLLSNVLKPLFAGIHLVHFFLPRTELLKISWENDLFLCFVQTLSAIIDKRFPNKLWVTNSSGNRQEETEMRINKIVRFSVCPCRLFIYLFYII